MKQNNITDKKIIGLTGGSGSGKSTIGRCSADDDLLYIDADRLGQQVILKGKPAFDELISIFGDSILGSDGEIHRKKLGGIVFSDPNKLAQLNRISHHYIKQEILKIIADTDKKGIIIDGAVIIGSIIQDMCDVIVSVLADKQVRIGRILERDGISREIAEKRIANQPDDKFYIENSDYIIYNNEETEKAINEGAEIFRRIIR